MRSAQRAIGASAVAAVLVASSVSANPIPAPALEPVLFERQTANATSEQQNATISETSGSANPADYAINSTSQFSGGASGNSFDPHLRTTVLNNTNLNFQPQAYVANGYFGARIPAAGVGYQLFEPTFNNETFHNGTQGWPLFVPRSTTTLLAGFYCQIPFDELIGTNFDIQPSQQVVSNLPSWTGLYISAPASNATNGTNSDLQTYTATIDPATVSNFSQYMNIEDGVVQTNVTWNGLQLTYTVFAHRLNPNVGAMRLDVSGIPEGSTVVISDTIDGSAAQRVMNETSGYESANGTNQVIYSSVMPQGVFNVTGWEFSAFDVLRSGNDSSQTSATSKMTNVTVPDSVAQTIGTNISTVAQSYALTGPNISVVKYVGLASSDAFAPNERQVALDAALQARQDGWDSLLSSHRGEWQKIWTEGGDVQIRNSRNDSTLNGLQTMARSSWFNLLSNLRRGSEPPGLGDQSIAPAGLVSDAYAEGIFWDAEFFMYPGLLAIYPDFAASINNYRSVKMLGAAYNNTVPYPQLSGLLYPWISYRYGNATGTGPVYQYEEHLNADIALAQWQYYEATGNATFLEKQFWPLVKGVADFWASEVKRQPDGKYTATNMTGPDEYSNHRNNEAFTMAGVNKVMGWAIDAAKILGYEDQIPANFSDIAANITVLQSNYTPSITVEFEGFDANTIVKQADVVLNTYPLEAPEFLQPNPLADLEFYAGSTAANGPGMTYSIFSIDSAQLAPAGCESYTYFRQSAEPYNRLPYYMFSEQTNDLYAFNNQTNPAFPFLTGMGGYLQTLINGFGGLRYRLNKLYLDPNLPPQLEEGIVITGMKYFGRTFDIDIGGNETTITMRSGEGTANVQIADANSKAGNYTLTVGQNLTVPTRRVDLGSPAVAGNIAQCLNTTTNSTWTPGNFDIAAIDGSNATFWQSSTNKTTALTADLGEARNFTSLHINWGRNPAVRMEALAGSDTGALQQIVNSTMVEISQPWDAATSGEVRLRQGNTTTANLTEPVTARYVQLLVEGAMIPDEFNHGSTVAELNVIS